MNIIIFNYELWRDSYLRYQKKRADKHLTKVFYFSLDEAIQKCKRAPRKYYILQESASSYQVIGSQEVKRLRKFHQVKNDDTFIDIHEKSFVVSPENIQRLIHEQHRRKWHVKWFNMFVGNYYKPVTEWELNMLKNIAHSIETNSKLPVADAIKEHFDIFIHKHS